MQAERLFGLVNDSIRQLATDPSEGEMWDFFCECADVSCHTLVKLSLVEFDERRAARPPLPILATHAI